MSYEGYVRALCRKGHLHIWDVYADGVNHCKYCGEAIVWWENVDQTNGEPHPFPLRRKYKEERKKCKECGHVYTVKEAVYCIPTKKEVKEWKDSQ